MSLSFSIRLSNGNRFDLTLNDSTVESTTVGQVKETIFKDHPDLPVDQQRLIYKGKILDDGRCLSEYGMVNQATLHLVLARATPHTSSTPNAASAPTASPVANVASMTTPGAATLPSSASPPLAAVPQATPMANPFSFPGSGNNLWQQLQQQQQQQMMQNPEMMQQMLNSPLMQSLLDNPQLLQNMMEINPQVRQLMDQNPELRQVFQDPQLMRQSMDLMQNPQHMQYLMRQQDLAMSQLENLPGGFSALSNLYHNVQEPMMEAMLDGRTGNSNNASGSSNSSQSNAATSATAGATGQAMPNPWGSSGTSLPATLPRSTATSTLSNNAMGNPTMTPTQPPATNVEATGLNWNSITNIPGPIGSVAPTPEQIEQTLQVLEQNPMMQQFMEQMFSNPQMLQSLLPPRLRQENPMVYDMLMQNPQMLRMMMNPANIRTMMQLQQTMPQQQPGVGGTGNMGMLMNPWGLATAPTPSMPNQLPAGDVTPPPLDFSNLLMQYQALGLGGGNPFLSPMTTTSTNNNNVLPPAADRFRHQLQSLYDMGFDDEQANLTALQMHHGNLNRAVDALIMGTVPTTSSVTPAASIHNPSSPSSTTTTTLEATSLDTAAATANQQTSSPSDSSTGANDNNNNNPNESTLPSSHPKKDVTEKKND